MKNGGGTARGPAAARVPGPVRFAFAAWVVLAVVFAALDTTAGAQPLRFWWRCIGLALPALVLPLALLLLSAPWPAARRAGLGVSALLFGLAALAWLLVGAAGRVLADSPWALVFWLGPSEVHAFEAWHPQLHVSHYPIDTVVADAEGRVVELPWRELAGATMTFDGCPPEGGPALFGGLPPHPAARCLFRYRLHGSDGERVTHVHAVEGGGTESGPRMASLVPHFTVWAKSAGAEVELRDSGGRRREVALLITRGEQRWSLRIVERRQSARVYLPEGGFAPPR